MRRDLPRWRRCNAPGGGAMIGRLFQTLAIGALLALVALLGRSRP
jgi:hypothetical protein